MAAVISSGLNTSVSVSSSAAGPHSHLCLAVNPIDHVRQTDSGRFSPAGENTEHRLTDLFLVRVIGGGLVGFCVDLNLGLGDCSKPVQYLDPIA